MQFNQKQSDMLIQISKAIMEKLNVSVEEIRLVDYKIAYGVYLDMTDTDGMKINHLSVQR